MTQATVVDTLGPPIGGLNKRDNGVAMPDLDCLQIDNIVPRPSHIELLDGSQFWCTGFTGDVKGIGVFRPASGSQSIVAAVGANLYVVTASGAHPVPLSNSSITNAYVDFANFATPATQYLVALNGTDSMRLWNGSAWTTVASFTYTPTTTIATTHFTQMVGYQGRAFFIPVGERAFYYSTTVGAISGIEVKRFDLDAMFPNGGYARAIARWTVDYADGPNDYLVIVSSAGDVVIFQGTDPADPAKWTYKGTFQMGPPLGRRCFTQYGGDLLLLASNGVWPISKAIVTGKVDKTISTSDKINPELTAIARRLGPDVEGWQILLHTGYNILVILVPDNPKVAYCMELTSKGWFRVVDWDVNCIATDQTYLWAGRLSMTARLLDSSPQAYGRTRQGSLVTAPNYFNRVGSNKQISMLRPIVLFEDAGVIQVGAATDFSTVRRVHSKAFSTSDVPRWDISQFDIARWREANGRFIRWTGVANAPGYSQSLYFGMQSSSGYVRTLTFDYILRAGRAV